MECFRVSFKFHKINRSLNWALDCGVENVKHAEKSLIPSRLYRQINNWLITKLYKICTKMWTNKKRTKWRRYTGVELGLMEPLWHCWIKSISGCRLFISDPAFFHFNKIGRTQRVCLARFNNSFMYSGTLCVFTCVDRHFVFHVSRCTESYIWLMSAVKEDIIVAVFIVTAAVAGMITHLLFLISLKDGWCFIVCRQN